MFNTIIIRKATLYVIRFDGMKKVFTFCYSNIRPQHAVQCWLRSMFISANCVEIRYSYSCQTHNVDFIFAISKYSGVSSENCLCLSATEYPKETPIGWCWHMEVLSIVFAPVIDQAMICYLTGQISILSHEYRTLFSALTITPKMHCLLQYPRLIRQVGPLVRHWVMRFGGKHHFFKKRSPTHYVQFQERTGDTGRR